jgi:UDP-glucose 4-epimerase
VQISESATHPAHILVTGGAGFIGSHTVDQLLREGHQVTVLDNLSSGKLGNLKTSTRLRVIEGDVCDVATLHAAFVGVDRVLHLAAQVSAAYSIAQPVHSANINVLGFLSVLEAARYFSVQRLVYASSAAVYADSQMPLDELSQIAPISPYGLEKRVNEEYAALYARLHGMQILGLRYFNVFGPGQGISEYCGVLTKFILQLQSRAALTIFGDGTQSRDFIHVLDIAALNVRALFSDYAGMLNVGSGIALTLNETIAILSEIAGYSPKLVYAPAQKGDIQHSCANISRQQSVLGSLDRVEFKAALEALFSRNFLSEPLPQQIRQHGTE